MADDPAPVAVPVTSATVEVSVPVVYPYKDSYRDTVTITATPSTADGTASTSTGVIVVMHGSKAVKSWTIAAATPTIEKWDGKTASKIVAGSYSVTVTYTNADASIVTASVTLSVSSKRTVSHTWTSKVTAWAAQEYCGIQNNVVCEQIVVLVPEAPTHEGGKTIFHYKKVKGTELSGGADDYDPLEFQFSSSVALPKSVKSAVKARMSVSGKVEFGHASGHKFYLSSCERSIGTGDAELCDHTNTVTKTSVAKSPTVTLADDSTRATWLTTVSKNTRAYITYYTVHVTYYTLK